MTLNAMMNRSAKIERFASDISLTGEMVPQWTTVAENVPCALMPARAATRRVEPGVRFETMDIAYFPPDTDVRTDQHAGLGDRVTIDGVAFIANAVTDIAGAGRMLRAELERES